jgi:hypothetical protein
MLTNVPVGIGLCLLGLVFISDACDFPQIAGEKVGEATGFVLSFLPKEKEAPAPKLQPSNALKEFGY